jgi:hypothetical protein
MVFLGYGFGAFLWRLTAFGIMEAFAKSKIRAPAIKEDLNKYKSNPRRFALSCEVHAYYA